MIKLITFDGNWADEMDFNSHLIVEEGSQDWENLKKVQSYSKETLKDTGWICVGLGSNEDVEYDDCLELYNQLVIQDITEEEAEVIKKYFGNEAGAASIDYVLENIIESVENSDEEDEDDDY